MKLTSSYSHLGEIELPKFQNRQMRMHQFNPHNPVMPDGFEDYHNTVASLCQRAGTQSHEAHMTVDEKVIQAGMSQRQPGAHVDGCYIPDKQRWGHYNTDGRPLQRMSIIVASSVPGCIVYEGEFNGSPKEEGDLEHIRDQFNDGILLPANRGFLLTPDCVHESKTFQEPTQRTFLRLAFHLNHNTE